MFAPTNKIRSLNRSGSCSGRVETGGVALNLHGPLTLFAHSPGQIADRLGRTTGLSDSGSRNTKRDVKSMSVSSSGAIHWSGLKLL